MGITIQQYRCRIGRFLPKKHFTSSTIISKDDIQASPKLNLQQLLLLLFAILLPFTIAFFQPSSLIHPKQSYNHPLYPTIQPEDYCNQYNLPGNATSDLSLIFIMKYGINIYTASLFSMITNFQSRYLNGNRKSPGIKISAWNKDKGFLQNKMPEIKNIVSGLNPHILGISEANLHSNHDKKLVQIDDYTLHTCPTLENPDLSTSRVVVYTHKSLIVKLRHDLMCNTYSSVWMEVGLPHHKKFLVGQTYREWQLPNQ